MHMSKFSAFTLEKSVSSEIQTKAKAIVYELLMFKYKFSSSILLVGESCY